MQPRIVNAFEVLLLISITFLQVLVAVLIFFPLTTAAICNLRKRADSMNPSLYKGK